MSTITELQYRYALERIEDLLPVVDGYDDSSPQAMELSILADLVIEYEKEHFPIDKPTVAQVLALSLEENNISQKELATRIGVSPSRISDYVTGRAEPSLRVASRLCAVLGIAPSVMLGL